MDGPRTSRGPVDWNGLWERYILCRVGCPWIVLGHPEDQWIGIDYGRDIILYVYCVGLDVHG